MLIRVLSVVGLAIGGGLVGVVGSAAHTSARWWGLVLSLLLVAASAVFAKAAQGWTGFAVAAGAWMLAVVALSQPNSMGSVLNAGATVDAVWVYGGALIWAMVAAIPRFVFVGSNVTS